MATPQDIAQNAVYEGSAALGGGNFGVINPDISKPLQDLTAYTVAYNKYKYEEKKKATDDKVNEIADLSKIQLNDLRGKDKDQATAELSDLYKKAGDYARSNPKTQEEKIKSELDWQTAKRGFMDNYTSGKTRAVSYQARRNEIMQNYTDASRQDAAIKDLDKEFDDTDIATKISALPNFKLESIVVPEPVKTDVSFVGVAPNDNTNVKGSIYIPANNVGSANATVLGINKKYPKKGSPEYAALSAREQSQADQQATVESTGKIWTDAVAPLNEALHQKDASGNLLYVNGDGSFNDEKFRKDYATNTVVLNAYDGVKKLHDYSTTMQQQIGTGLYTDKNIQYKLPADLQASQFDAGIIDWTRDIQPNQLVMAGSFAKDKGNEFTKTLQHTGEANDLEKVRLQQRGENYRAKLAHPDLPQVSQNFGNLIYGVNIDSGNVNAFKLSATKAVFPDVAGIKDGAVVDKSGKILSDKTGDIDIPAKAFNNSIITEYNKYVGGKTVVQDKDGVITTTDTNGGGSMLKPNENKELKVRFENGVIKGIYAEDGTLIDDNLFSHITQKAGQQGTTKYKQSDTQYGKFDSDNSSSNMPDGKLNDAQYFIKYKKARNK